jgi:hypothetical protein
LPPWLSAQLALRLSPRCNLRYTGDGPRILVRGTRSPDGSPDLGPGSPGLAFGEAALRPALGVASATPVAAALLVQRRMSPRRNKGSAGEVCRWAWAGEADRAISTGQLRGLPRFHLRPIDVMVSHGSQARPGFEEGFPLRCFQRLSRPHLATRRCGWRHNRYTRGASLPVLSY